MKKILITGGAGYVGAYVAQYLKEKGYDIIIYDNLSTGHKEHINDYKFYHADLSDEKKLNECFLNEKPHLVIHLAASALVHESQTNPILYYKNNVENSIKLTNAMLKHGCKNMIFSSSGASYGESKKVPMIEDHPQQPINTYGLSKLMFEMVLKDMSEKKMLSYVVFRFFNAAGEIERFNGGETHDPETHFIPNLCKMALREDTLSIFGSNYKTKDGTCVRDYVHVEDLCEAHFLAIDYLKNKNESLICNLGSGKGYSLLEIINSFEKIIDKKINTKQMPPRLGDPAELYADITHAKTKLNWQPKKDLDDILNSAWKYHSKKV
ncbi:MAG TPA: UDP-glucose 4-epimerase GalE [Oligoflexia bacterium]|nr:UDP-glucose 4-epimerase GalE [Oligoflexia bacterium]HMR23817.1 UDP-glucose 4-epimerase GalE [Oligoflexia bacterium]